jgi:hypothetical protein
MDEQQPSDVPVPDTPPPESSPEPAPETRWFHVEFVAPAGMDTPIEAQGFWWMERSVHVLPELCARTLAAQLYFTLLHETTKPANAGPCNCH